MSVSVAIVAHYSRDKWTVGLVGNLSAQGFSAIDDIGIFRDDGTIGPKTNHLRAWEWLANQETDWGVVLEDDVTLCEDFHTNLTQALEHAPSSVVSLYLGRGRPPQYQERIAVAISQEISFITAPVLLSAQGIAMPTPYFNPSIVNQVSDNELPIDEAISRWLDNWKGTVSYPKYSLVDHRDGPTLIADHGDGQGRNGNTSLVLDGCDPSGGRLPEIRKAWLTATHNTPWNLGSIPLLEGAVHESHR